MPRYGPPRAGEMAPECLPGGVLQPLRNTAGDCLGAKGKRVFTFSQPPPPKNTGVMIIRRQAVQRAGFCLCHRPPPPWDASSIVCLVVAEAVRDALSSFLFLLPLSLFQPFHLLCHVRGFGPARRTPNGLGLTAGGSSDSRVPECRWNDPWEVSRGPRWGEEKVCHRRKGFLPVRFLWTLWRLQVSGPLDHQRRQILRFPAWDPETCLQKQQDQPEN